MIAFLLYALASFGFAFIVGFAKISLPFRSWIAQKTTVIEIDRRAVDPSVRDHYPPSEHEEFRFGAFGLWFIALLECPACLGFWLGVFAALADRWFGFIALANLTSAPLLFSAVFLGCVVSASNFILGVFTRLIEVR